MTSESIWSSLYIFWSCLVNTSISQFIYSPERFDSAHDVYSVLSSAMMRIKLLLFAVFTWITGTLLLATFLAVQVNGQASSTFSPARPPAIPLGVKSPWFNTWLFAGPDEGNGGYLPGRWQQFWA